MSEFEDLLVRPGFIFSRVQRNHGLEHATLHMLAKTHPHLALAGISNPQGFWILGNVETEDLRAAVDEALTRLRNGERGLAVHPNCGTNFATTGLLAGVATWLVMAPPRRKREGLFDRLPSVISLATLAVIAGQPLGMLLQERVTTSGVPGGLEVVEIQPTYRGQMRAHHVLTRG
jgi:hypothetical protein